MEDTQKLTGCEIERGYVDKGYRDDTENLRRVFVSDKSAVSSASSNANCDDAPPSSP